MTSLSSEENLTTIINLIGSNDDDNSKNMLNNIFIKSLNNNYSNIYNKLISDPRVDLSFSNNKAIKTASQNGYAGIVEQLLVDPNVDPCVDNNLAIKYSCRHIDVIRLLLADTRVDINACSREIIMNAYYATKWDVIELILNDPKIDLTLNNFYTIRYFSMSVNRPILEKLLPKIKQHIPKIDDKYVILIAQEMGLIDNEEYIIEQCKKLMKPSNIRGFLYGENDKIIIIKDNQVITI